MVLWYAGNISCTTLLPQWQGVLEVSIPLSSTQDRTRSHTLEVEQNTQRLQMSYRYGAAFRLVKDSRFRRAVSRGAAPRRLISYVQFTYCTLIDVNLKSLSRNAGPFTQTQWHDSLLWKCTVMQCEHSDNLLMASPIAHLVGVVLKPLLHDTASVVTRKMRTNQWASGD